MAYATIDDVFARYPAIATNVGTKQYDVTSNQVSSTYLHQNEGLINSFLSQRYQVPLSVASLNPMITMINADLAIFDMLVDKLPNIPEFAQGRYDRAMDLLKMLAKGELDLTGATENNTTGGDQEIWSTTMEYHPVFSPVLDPLEQAADSDRVDADRTDRDGEISDADEL